MASGGQRDQPADADEQVKPRVPADEQAAQALDLVGERVDARDHVQPAGHDRQRVQRAGGEEQRHHDQLADAHEALALLDQRRDQHRQAGKAAGAERQQRPARR